MTSDKQTTVVLHINHENEITDSVRDVVAKMTARGMMVLSQSVLLRGVNDNAETLENLFRALVSSGIKPYYLHHPDKAPGTSHFRVTVAEGLEIFGMLQGRLTGIALPKYVIDIPGGFGKVPVASAIRQDDGYLLTDFRGELHFYKD
jgi:lysine 2,3-aminomutase